MRKLNILEMNRLTLQEFKQSQKAPLVVVLDDIRSMYNVGSVFRTADAFRIQAIYLCGITSRPPHPEIHKTALGAEESVDWQYWTDTADAVRHLHEQGFAVMAVEQAEGSILLHNFADEMDQNLSQRPLAIVLGNEVQGVKQNVVDMCDACIEIPQFGTKHSLNVSTAAGIVMWELIKLKLKTLQQQ